MADKAISELVAAQSVTPTDENTEMMKSLEDILKQMSPEDAQHPVLYAELIAALTSWENQRLKYQDELDKAREASFSRIIDALIERINKERYERKRFEFFIVGLLCAVCNLDRQAVEAEHARFVKDFDMLNFKKKGEENA